MYPFNTSLTEPATAETTQTLEGEKTSYNQLNIPISFAVSTRRLLAVQRNSLFRLNYDNVLIGLNNQTRNWDPSPLSYNLNYSSSNGVTANTWYDQSVSGYNLKATDPITSLPITQGMSQDWALITGVGTRPAFFMSGPSNYVNPLNGDFTWICLMRASVGGEAITSLNWRTASLGLLCDGRIGTANDDISIGIGLTNLYVGMGRNGSTDTYLAGTVPIVNGIYPDPKLLVVTRNQSTGLVEIRVNRAPDTSGTLSTGPLSGISQINMYPNAYISEMIIFNQVLDLATIQQVETEIALYYGLP